MGLFLNMPIRKTAAFLVSVGLQKTKLQKQSASLHYTPEDFFCGAKLLILVLFLRIVKKTRQDENATTCYDFEVSFFAVQNPLFIVLLLLSLLSLIFLSLVLSLWRQILPPIWGTLNCK